jgi:hypothetical protein
MKEVTVFCRVGRANPQPLASFNADHPNVKAACDAVESNKFAELLRSGVAADRVKFSRETRETKE